MLNNNNHPTGPLLLKHFIMEDGIRNVSENITICSNKTYKSIEMRNFDWATRWTIASVMSGVTMTTFLFNIIIIVRIIWTSKHKLFTKFFLISLACADLLVCLTIMPFSIFSIFRDTRWLLGNRTCDMANSFDVMASTSSIIHLWILSFERYIAICRPFQYNTLCNRKSMVIFSTLCWAIAASFSFGLIFPGYHSTGVEHIAHCFAELEMTCVFVVNVYYAVIGSSVTIVLPGIFIVWCNIKVMKRVQQFKAINKQTAYGQKTGESRSMRVARTISTLTAFFLICWAPFFFCNLFNVLMNYFIPDYIMLMVTWLGYTNSAVNPILYLLLEGKNCIGRG